MYKIAFLVTRSDQVGGSHIHVRDLAVALQGDGHKVAVFIGGDGPVIEHFEGFGLNVVTIPSMQRNIAPLQDVKAYSELKKEISLFDPDLVTTHSSKAGFLGRLIARRLKKPVMFTAHGWAFTDGKSSVKRTIYKMLERSVVPITDQIIAVSDYDRKLAMKHLNLGEDQIQTIYNGMPDIDESMMAHQENQDPVNIVMVARFDPPKDQQELLRAVPDIENIHVHFVGDGPFREEAENLAEELGVRDQVTFWGELDSADKVYAQAQIFVLISNWEGFPLSTLEAMRAGLPTIVSDVGGAPEAVEEGETGYAIKKGDVQALRLAIKELADDVEKRKKMGHAARKRYEELYTFKHMYDETVAVYEDLLNSNQNKHEK